MQFLTTEKLSSKREMTPEGYMLCRDVVIARVGTQLYGPDETPIKGVDGRVVITRDESEVFSPDTIASANGKSLVNEHPDEDVEPDNWAQLSLGILMNARRGTGADIDHLLVDILVTTPKGIQLIEDGKRELSCGYDAVYEQTEPGKGRQKNIIINHAALVKNGRCGPRCSIGDQKTVHVHDCECKENKPMTKKATVKDRLYKLLGVKDEAEFNEKLQEEMPEATGDDTAGEGAQHIHVHLNGGTNGGAATVGSEATGDDDIEGDDDTPAWFQAHVASNNARFDKIEQALGALSGGEETMSDEDMEGDVPEEEIEDAIKAKDSRFFQDSFQETAATAEIIVPGIRIPTFDAKNAPKKTLGAIDNLRRTTLDLAYNTPEMRSVIDEVIDGKTYDSKTMKRSTLRQTFKAVGAFKRRQNTSGGRRQTTADEGVGGGLGYRGPVKTNADLNARMKAFYKH